MRKACVALVVALTLTAGGCPTKKGEDLEPKEPGAGRICEKEGQVAGHGARVFHCRKDKSGRLVWRTK